MNKFRCKKTENQNNYFDNDSRSHNKPKEANKNTIKHGFITPQIYSIFLSVKLGTLIRSFNLLLP